MCVPRFDSSPLFCGLLDADRGGLFLITPEDLRSSEQWYVEETAVLVTRTCSTTGVIDVTDAFSLRSESFLEKGVPAANGALPRRVRVVAGNVRLHVLNRPGFDGDIEDPEECRSWLLP
ncbi:trehalase-like domain-containing protein [Streptomyces sp. KMM 9044]|uniref:trehalase-like domain-containing protein n=1 Tax=Streptomyces sp. KMM 9044 TaxID=2744474 RepID=UPI0021518581|nr:trehalase-like domain-containing protein [Streptomyces sp. KMM 9044]WAX80227.1 DUF5911 domain-containing protein [Streptomyces sp. KMM 9044]